MADIFNMADTWNDAGTTFTAIKMDVTDTASNAASLLLNLQVGGTSRFSVDKSGNIYTRGLQRFTSAVSLGWTSASDPTTGTDLTLFRDAANTLAQRNGTSAQTFNIYNSYTDGSNFERGQLVWSSNVLYLQTAQAGTGTARNLHIRTGGASVLLGGTAGSPAWSVAAANGHLVPGANDTYDLGSTSLAPRDIFRPGGTRAVFRTITAITSGAGVGAGTLTNAPSAGDPTKWIPINDNGTTRYIPAW